MIAIIIVSNTKVRVTDMLTFVTTILFLTQLIMSPRSVVGTSSYLLYTGRSHEASRKLL